MALISIFLLGLANSYFVIKKNFILASENYFADVLVENILNLAESEFDFKKSINDILDSYDKFFLDDNIYHDKFYFNIRLNEIDKNFNVIKDSLEIINPNDEDLSPIDTEIVCDNKDLINIFSLDSTEKNYLITVDLYNKNHKFLKRIIKIK